MLLLLIFTCPFLPPLPLKSCGVSFCLSAWGVLCGWNVQEPMWTEGAAFKTQWWTSTYVVLAYFFDPGILISCCHVRNLFHFGSHLVFCILSLFWFFLWGFIHIRYFFLTRSRFSRSQKLIIISHEIILDTFYISKDELFSQQHQPKKPLRYAGSWSCFLSPLKILSGLVAGSMKRNCKSSKA